MKYESLLLLFLFILTSSCKESEKEKLSRLVKEWQGKEIVFPEKSVFTVFGKDTVDYVIPDSEYKVLVYVDSLGCTSCKLQLHKWKELIAYTDSLTGGSVPYLFFFQSKDDNELHYILKRDNFNRPVCFDRNNQLNELNNFPADITFQTFLLDKNNKVLALGNPIHNISVKELYLKQITGKNSPNTKQKKTTVEVIQREIDFGIFNKTEVKRATFEIKNIGENPLVIVDVSTTCGCTVASYDKRPAKPGDMLRVGLEMTPKDTGFFDETITIRCNTNEPVKVKIKGNVQ